MRLRATLHADSRHLRELDTVLADALALLTEAAALLGKACALRGELADARPTTGAAETERIMHGAAVATIEAGLEQAFAMVLRELRSAQERAGGAEPVWLRDLLHCLDST